MLLATYLYSSQDRLRPPPIRIVEYEKTTVGGDPSYFDLEPSPALKPRTPGLRGSEALTTSRPGTPNLERKQFLKRDE